MLNHLRTRRSALLLLLAGALAVTTSFAKDNDRYKSTKFKTLYTLGDSLSDTGNLATVLGFSNGPVLGSGGPLGVVLKDGRLADSDLYINKLAAALTSSQDATAGALGGGNFAFAGAVSDANLGPYVPFNLAGTDLQSQKEQLLAYTGSKFKKKDLIVIFIGSNDIFAATTATLTSDPGSFDPAAALGVSVAHVVDVVQKLNAAGAANFVVFDSADVSRTPALQAQLPPEGLALARNLAISFNTQLFAAVGALRGDTNFSANVWYVPTFATTEFIASPIGARVTGIHSTAPCAPDFGSAVPCEESSFWDFVHPTSSVHSVLADVARTVLRLPALVRGR